MNKGKRLTRAASVLGLALLLGAAIPSGVSAAEAPAVGDAWAAGADSNMAGYNGNTKQKNKLNPLDKQGQFNFYYWYVPHDYGKAVDYSKMKLCAEGNPIEYINTTQFMPEVADIKTVQDPNKKYEHNAEYFTFTDWGALSGSSGFGGVNGFDPVIELRAPVSGTYLVEIYLGGGIRLDANGNKQDDGSGRVSDGVVWKVLDTGKKALFTKEYTGDSIPLYDKKLNKDPVFKNELKLAAGESLFISADQRGSSICDDAAFSLRSTLKKISNEAPATTTTTKKADAPGTTTYAKTPGITGTGSTTGTSAGESSEASATTGSGTDAQASESEQTTAASDTPAGPGDETPGLSGGATAGIVVAAVVVLGGGGFALYYFVLRKKIRPN